MRIERKMRVGLLGLGALLSLAGLVNAGGDEHHHTAPPPQGRKPPVRITMEELHRHGGVPPGWVFTLPPGNRQAGREVFGKLECYTCHAVQGEPFPQPGKAGPRLDGVGSHHPAAYMVESIADPNAVIVTGPGYTGSDGRSIMPEYTESLTVKELIDLVAYLKSLTTSDGGGGHSHAPTTDRAHPGDGSSHRMHR